MEIGTVDVGLIIHGAGLDEISPLGPSTIVEIRNVNMGKPGRPRWRGGVRLCGWGCVVGSGVCVWAVL
jgi:hypothetical protein